MESALVGLWQLIRDSSIVAESIEAVPRFICAEVPINLFFGERGMTDMWTVLYIFR